MFSKDDFQSWGKKNVVLFAATATRIEGRKDDGLLRTYGFSGFPSMALLGRGRRSDDQENPSLRRRDPDEHRRSLRARQAREEWKPPAKRSTRTRSFSPAWGVGKLKLEDAKTQCASLKLSDADKSKADQMIFGMEMNGVMGKMRSVRPRSQCVSRRERRGPARKLLPQLRKRCTASTRPASACLGNHRSPGRTTA